MGGSGVRGGLRVSGRGGGPAQRQRDIIRPSQQSARPKNWANLRADERDGSEDAHGQRQIVQPGIEPAPHRLRSEKTRLACNAMRQGSTVATVCSVYKQEVHWSGGLHNDHNATAQIPREQDTRILSKKQRRRQLQEMLMVFAFVCDTLGKVDLIFLIEIVGSFYLRNRFYLLEKDHTSHTEMSLTIFCHFIMIMPCKLPHCFSCTLAFIF